MANKYLYIPKLLSYSFSLKLTLYLVERKSGEKSSEKIKIWLFGRREKGEGKKKVNETHQFLVCPTLERKWEEIFF